MSDDISLNTAIGEGSSFVGNINVCGFMRIDGDLDGNLQASGHLIVGEKARIRGDVTAASVEIWGVIDGNVHAAKYAHIFSSSVILGDVVTHQLKIEKDAVIQGHCISLKDENEFISAKSHLQNVKAIKESSVTKF